MTRPGPAEGHDQRCITRIAGPNRGASMKRIAAVLAVLVVAAACADEGESHREGTMKTRPSQVRGSITGRVLNPLKEPITAAVVRVTLPSGVRSVPVDANGYFAVHNLPAGGTLPV